MKKLLFILTIFACFTTCGIKVEIPTPSTIFEGPVVYADDGSPVDERFLHIVSFLHSPIGSGSKSGPSQFIILDETGEFKVEFAYNKEIVDFSLGIDVPVLDSLSPLKAVEADCSPHKCIDFKPGLNYSNLIIKAPRP